MFPSTNLHESQAVSHDYLGISQGKGSQLPRGEYPMANIIELHKVYTQYRHNSKLDYIHVSFTPQIIHLANAFPRLQSRSYWCKFSKPSGNQPSPKSRTDPTDRSCHYSKFGHNYSKLAYIQSFVHVPNNPFGQHLSKKCTFYITCSSDVMTPLLENRDLSTIYEPGQATKTISLFRNPTLRNTKTVLPT